MSKREFVTCGLSCGLAAAFGAPIGATLFGYEMSKPNTFWEVKSTWRTMLSCCIAVMVYALMRDLLHVKELGNIQNWVLNASTLKFEDSTYPAPTIASLPTALIIGIICGCAGAFFIWANTYVVIFRQEYIKSPFARVVEVSVLSFITTSFAFWLPYLMPNSCAKDPTIQDDISASGKWRYLV